MTIWFTADTHFGHNRIIQYCKRPFQNHQEMEEKIIQNFNEVLHPGDLIYHLGDVAWSTWPLNRLKSRLKCKNLHLILGNHDNRKENEYRQTYTSVNTLKTIHIQGYPHVTMCHYPMRSWPAKGYGAYHLFGHCHGTLAMFDRSFDVGVDPSAFRLVSLEEVHQRLKDIPIFQSEDKDHHRRSIDSEA